MWLTGINGLFSANARLFAYDTRSGDGNRLRVRAGRDLGDDAAELRMFRRARDNFVRQHLSPAPHERNRGLVAGSLDSQNQRVLPDGEGADGVGVTHCDFFR